MWCVEWGPASSPCDHSIFKNKRISYLTFINVAIPLILLVEYKALIWRHCGNSEFILIYEFLVKVNEIDSKEPCWVMTELEFETWILVELKVAPVSMADIAHLGVNRAYTLFSYFLLDLRFIVSKTKVSVQTPARFLDAFLSLKSDFPYNLLL